MKHRIEVQFNNDEVTDELPVRIEVTRDTSEFVRHQQQVLSDIVRRVSLSSRLLDTPGLHIGIDFAGTSIGKSTTMIDRVMRAMQPPKHTPPTKAPDLTYLAMQGDWSPAVGCRVCVHSVEYDEKPWFGHVIERFWLGREDYAIRVRNENTGEMRWCSLAELSRPAGEVFAQKARDADGRVCP